MRGVPGELEGLRDGDGVWSGALAHAVQLVQRNVQAEEELQGVFGDGGSSCVALVAAIQAQSSTHLLENQFFCELITHWCTASCSVSTGTQKQNQISV